MAASALALPSGQWQPACWLTHFYFSLPSGLPSFQLHRLLRVLKLYYKVASSHLPAPQILRVLKLYYKVASSHLPAPQILRVLKLYYTVASSQLPAPQIAPHYKVASSHLPARQILRVLKLYYKVASSHLPAPQILRVLKLYYKVASSQLPAPQIAPRTKVVLQSRQFSASEILRALKLYYKVTSSHLPAPQILRVLKLYYKVTNSHLPAPQILRVLKLYYKVASSQLPAPQITPRTKVVLQSRQCLHFAHSTRTISAEGCAHTGQVALSPAFRALDTHDLRRGLRGHPANRTLACISRTRHARSPQRVARTPNKSHSRLHFAHSTRTISAEGCAHTGQIALSPAFRALDTHDLRRGLRANRTNRTLTCISRTRHARSPQRVARGPDKSHSRLHFAHSTRTISAEGCARTGQIALSPAFRALDTHDLRRGLRGHPANRTLACISGTRHARSPQRVARGPDKSRAHSTRTISAEGCAHTRQIALSPAFRALDTHDLRRGLHFRLTLFVPHSAFKREFLKWGNVFSLGHLPSILTLAYSLHACIVIACLHTHPCISRLHTYTCIL